MAQRGPVDPEAVARDRSADRPAEPSPPGEEPAKVLVVDDDEDITLTISEYFKSQDLGIIPIATSDPRKVLPILEENPDISLILSDFRMPGLNGFELLMMVKAQYPKVLFVIMTGYSTQELKREGFKRGAIRYIEKPFDLGELAETIKEALQGASSGFGGLIEAIQLPDIIQLIGMSRRTVTLNITADQGKAAIYFREGEIVHSVCGDLKGGEAFYEVFRWTGGRFTFAPVPGDVPQTITQPWQGLLLEAARLEDESAAAEIGGDNGEVKPDAVVPSGEPVVALDELEEQPPAQAAEVEDPFAGLDLSSLEPVTAEQAATDSGPPPAAAAAPETAPATTADAGLTALADNWPIEPDLLARIEAALQAFQANWKVEGSSATFDLLKVSELPEPLSRHFLHRYQQALQRVFKTDYAPFDFDRPAVSKAVEELSAELLNAWKLTRQEYDDILRGGVAYEVKRCLDPARALVDFVQQNTGGVAGEISALLETITGRGLVDAHFASLADDLARQQERRIHPRQLEYFARAILYRREEEEGFASMRAAANELFELAGMNVGEGSLRLRDAASMLEAHGVVQVADFLRGEGGGAQRRVTLNELDATMRKYLEVTRG